MLLKKFKSTWWPEILFLTIISALVYLPQAARLSFHSDDWYFIFNGLVNGPKAFIDLTLHTRPIRGPLYEFLFSLYGLHPLPYNLTLYFWRLLGGLGAAWLFNLLWPRQRQANFFVAALFLVFPGFLWWVSGFEFQPYVLSLTLQVFSIVFTLKAVGAKSRWGWLGWAIAAVLSGWIYLALVEFAIGMEAFRILAVFVFLKRKNPLADFKNLSMRTIRASAFFLITPISFVYWYQFIFDNWRKAQQASVQLSRILEDPLTAVNWLVRLFQGVINVTLTAWLVPFNGNFYSGQPQDFLVRFAIGAVVIAIVALTFFFFTNTTPDETPEQVSASSGWQVEMLWVGFLGTLAGVIPVVVANRTVTFNFSQYALPASLAGILILGGLVYSISSRKLRLIVLSILIGLAALTHQAIAYKAVTEEQTIYNFWWQVSWRAPDIRSGTTLLAQYPFEIGDGDSLIWGPANFIYYPVSQNQSPAEIALSAITLQPETIKNIKMGGQVNATDLVITNAAFHYDFDKLLMMTQGDSSACMRVINPAWPEYSIHDNGLILAAAPFAKVDGIGPGTGSLQPPQSLFGKEPAHGWCYFYQKADYARQFGDWQEIVKLGDQARKQNLNPNDAIEWMPFLQAYAISGDVESLNILAKSIKKEPFYKKQACQVLTQMNEKDYPLPADVMAEAERLFCDE